MENLKTCIYFFLMFGLLLGAAGCEKDEEEKVAAFTCTTCKNTPDAKAENNASSKGVYKGVVVGSSGIITFDLQNSGATVNASLTLDGQVILLTATNLPVAGQTFTGTFTGTFNAQSYSISFTVGATGANPTITAATIPGHATIKFQLYKETSDNLIQAFEGTTEGVKDSGAKQTGQLNLLASTKTSTWAALSTNSGSTGVNIVTGKISGSTFTCDCGATTTVVGTLAGDEITGTYKGSDNHGTWTAKRTL